MVAGEHGNHRVAAGERMVGQEQHRLAARRHLQCPGDGALAGQFAVLAAGERQLAHQAHADAVGLRRHLPGLALQQRNRFGREPVGARAKQYIEQHFVTRSGKV